MSAGIGLSRNCPIEVLHEILNNPLADPAAVMLRVHGNIEQLVEQSAVTDHTSRAESVIMVPDYRRLPYLRVPRWRLSGFSGSGRSPHVSEDIHRPLERRSRLNSADHLESHLCDAARSCSFEVGGSEDCQFCAEPRGPRVVMLRRRVSRFLNGSKMNVRFAEAHLARRTTGLSAKRPFIVTVSAKPNWIVVI